MNGPVHAMRLCPFLGFADDPQTSQSFPSVWNCCHRCHPIASVHLRHQREFCLTDRHGECEVYLREAGQSLPEPLRSSHTPLGQTGRVPWRKIAVLLLVGGSLAVLVVGVINMMRSGSRQELPANSTEDQVSVKVSLTPGKKSPVPTFFSSPTVGGWGIGGITPSPTITLTLTSTQIPTLTSTATMMPTVARTHTPTLRVSSHQLEKPIGTDRKFILHRIKGGETFKKYAETYGTNVAAILAVNYEMQFPLWPGTIVVIPLDFTDVNGLPRFEPYQIQNPDLTVESLARAFEVQSSDLLEYNGISDWEQLMVGDWILIPHRVPNQ